MGNFTRPSRLAVRKTGKARGFYSRSFLFRELLPAAERCSDTEFAKFQAECLKDHIDGLNLSSLLALIEEVGPDGRHQKFILHESYNLPNKAQALYSNIAEVDTCTNYAAKYIGNAILNSDVMPLEQWFDTEVYHYFKIPLQIHHSASIVYRIPFRQRIRFRFVIFSNISKIFSSEVTNDEVEYFMLPLYLGWLRRKCHIDSDTLSNWLEMLVGMTPMRLALLREMVNIGRYQNAAVARKLNISDRMVSNYIAEAYDHISHQLPAPEFGEANLSRCVDLVRCYGFLSLVGVSTNEFEFL